MRIAHVTSSISRIGAGVSKVVRDLAEAQADNDCIVDIFSLQDQFTHIDIPDQPGITLTACPVMFSPRFGYSRSLYKALSMRAGSIDVIHMHGLWMYPNWAAGRMARKCSTPYIMSPHGMLEPWGLDRSRWKKKLSGCLFEYNNLAKAHCLHACSEQEALSFRHLGYKGAIALIPLGLTRAEFNFASETTLDNAAESSPQSSYADKKILLFLSRLHEKKGLEVLLDTWQSIGSNYYGWHLVVAGDGATEYITKLQDKVRVLGIEDSVTFVGAVHGDHKWELLRKADIFVLPTYSENFGLVIAEALASGVPVITTKGAPWGDLETEECGWWIDIGLEPLKDCLINALSLPTGQLSEMGVRGRRLVKKRYMVGISACTMHDVYGWMLNGGRVPDCMRFD